MPEPSKQSLNNAATLISNHFTDRERQFSADLAIYLQRRIIQRRNVVIMGDSSSAINDNKKFGIKISKNLTSATIGTVGGAIVAGIAFATPIGPIVGGVAVAVGAGALAYGAGKALKAIPKKRIEQNAKIYYKFFPKEHSGMIKLFSQFASLSVVEKLKTVLIAQEIPTVFQELNKITDKVIDKLPKARRVSRQEEKEKIEKLAEEEFAKIWSIFKEFTREREVYSSFKETAWSKKITDLFARHCDLGDPTDMSEIENDFTANILWINVLARYLEEKGSDMREEIFIRLNNAFGAQAHDDSMLNAARHQSTIEEVQSTVSLSSQNSSSSGVSTGNSSLSQALVRRHSLPQFFAPQAAAETLVANQPEPESNPILSTRL